jgi:hypothetical protein
MEWIQLLLDIIRFILPALLVLLAFRMTFQSLAARESEKHRLDKQFHAFTTIMPLKLAAYERLLLFLERIRPHAVIDRADPNYKSAKALYQTMMIEVLAEYEHNIVQQLYVSEKAWRSVTAARNRTLALFEETAKQMTDKSTGFEYAQAVRNATEEWTADDHPIENAIQIIKKEVIAQFS